MAKNGDTAFRATLTSASTYTGNTTIGQAVVFAQNQSALGTALAKRSRETTLLPFWKRKLIPIPHLPRLYPLVRAVQSELVD